MKTNREFLQRRGRQNRMRCSAIRTAGTLALRLGLCVLMGAGAASVQALNLHIGDTAPLLKVDRWIKGGPVPEFEKGKVYVVEFWATWCGPCRQAMPHLSELAKKYAGRATFVGVDIWEEQHSKPGENLKLKSDQFVKQMGSRMGYNVCAGSDDEFMVKNWMEAAGQSGIPATFVIGKDSKLAWIGHPIDLDGPLAQILDDKFDVQAFAAKTNPRIDSARTEETQGREFMKPVEAAVKAKDFGLAVRECDKGMASCLRVFKFGLAMRKYEILTKYRPADAYSEAIKCQADPDQRWMASEVFSMAPGLDKRCYQFALNFFQEKYKDQPTNINGPAHYAYVYLQLGEPSKAVGFYEQYLSGLKKMKVDPVTIESGEKELRRFKDAAAQQSAKP